MSAKFPNFYLSWLAQHRPELELADRVEGPPPEKFLQGVWAHQRLLRDKLRTLDGRPVRVIHPGFLNREAGPDFQKAVIQIGDDPARPGDIEIDLAAAGWDQHAHKNNPAYSEVILHVLWDDQQVPRKEPAMALKPFLDSPIGELSFWLGSENVPAPANLAGNCSAPFRSLDRGAVAAVLKQAAEARLHRKASAIQASARSSGWEQALWEGLFVALGYKRNTWPMRRLAELRTQLDHTHAPAIVLQARLFGLSGLLPSVTETIPRASQEYVRNLWDVWWRDAESLRAQILPRQAWNLAGIRPANHPERRLALAAQWLAKVSLVSDLENWLHLKIDSPNYLSSLAEVFRTDPDPFWSRHFTIRSKESPTTQPLLGPQRLTDLAMNVVLPWLWVRAVAGQNTLARKQVEQRYFNWPCGEDNAVIKLARQRLFATSSPEFVRTAAEQQGMLQIVRDFCDHSNAACQLCSFPELLKAFLTRNP